MITRNTYKNGISPFWDIRGKSTDEKPTVGIPNGSTYLEVNTGKLFVYDEEAKQWNEV